MVGSDRLAKRILLLRVRSKRHAPLSYASLRLTMWSMLMIVAGFASVKAYGGGVGLVDCGS